VLATAAAGVFVDVFYIVGVTARIIHVRIRVKHAFTAAAITSLIIRTPVTAVIVAFWPVHAVFNFAAVAVVAVGGACVIATANNNETSIIVAHAAV
jgi:hypothetical protein